MTIKFMFNNPVDASLLYACTDEVGESPFGGEETMQVEIRRSKEYSEAVLNDLKSTLSGLTDYKYRGSRERISREAFQLTVGSTAYDVFFVFDKREENNIQLHVEIVSPAIDDPDFETRYDKTLEILKLALKDRISRDWQACTWLIDDQSEILCANLYPRFFRTENRLRAFVNELLIQHMGQNWLSYPGLEHYKASIRGMENSFKQTVPQFANIDSSLLSMTVEMLSELILEAKVYKSSLTFTSADISKVYEHLKGQNIKAAREHIQRKRTIEIDLWNDLFSRYFLGPEQFVSALKQFTKSRNHVAHNKLITIAVFKQIHNELQDFEIIIKNAATEFEEKNASEELLDTWQYEQEQEDDEQYWRDRIFGETGVEIRDEDEIYELLCQTVIDLYDTLSDRYHYDPCFDISDMETPVKDGTTKLCTIKSNASGEELVLFVSIVLDDDMDSSSYLTIEAKHSETDIGKVECMYHNGEGHEGEEGLCVADSDSEYDDTEVHDFLEDLIAYIEEYLNPYVKQVATMEYEHGRHGGEPPVADFPCQECGKEGVSITEYLLSIGKCCYCGYENEIHICELCGTVYDDYGGDEHLCNGCMPRDD